MRGTADARPRRSALDLVPRPQQPALRRAAAAPRAARRVPAAPARPRAFRAGVGFRAFVAAKPLLLRTVLGGGGAGATQPAHARLRPARPLARRRGDGRRRPVLHAARGRADAAARRCAPTSSRPSTPRARYESLGVEKPWVVIPQGVNLARGDAELCAEQAAGASEPGEVVLGWMAAHLLTERRPRRRQPALQRRPPARAVGRDPRAGPERPAVARRRPERARARAARGPRATSSSGAAAARRRSRPQRTSTSRRMRARQTRAFARRRCRS